MPHSICVLMRKPPKNILFSSSWPITRRCRAGFKALLRQARRGNRRVFSSAMSQASQDHWPRSLHLATTLCWKRLKEQPLAKWHWVCGLSRPMGLRLPGQSRSFATCYASSMACSATWWEPFSFGRPHSNSGWVIGWPIRSSWDVQGKLDERGARLTLLRTSHMGVGGSCLVPLFLKT